MEGLRLEQISKSYGNKKVLDRVCLTVAQGEFCILLGPSGCGKTTLLRIIAGLVRQDTGSIHIDTREVSGLEPRDRDIAMVFQSYALYPHLRVYENMAFPLRLKKAARPEIETQVRQAARMLAIEQLLDRKPAELSGGQRQRVAIGRALVRNPRLFLFDEPLSNLDAQLRTSMRVELARLHRALNKTIVYVTHDQTEAMTLGQKVVVFDRGTVQQIGTPQEIYARPVNLFVASFIGNPSINIITGRLERDSRGLHFHSGDLDIAVGAREALSPFAGREMSIGIRPEALQPGTGPFAGRVEYVENLGGESILHLRVGQHPLVSRLPGAVHRVSCGDHLSLCADPDAIHFFHRGIRVDQGDTP